jgi:ubiquinone/menaquinone biosynthesis C-methylase UbiE
MPLFHRKDEDSPSHSASPARAPARQETDWRSFDSIAETYANVFAPHLGLVAADLVKLLDVAPGQRVLDVGTGTGVGARAAARAVGAEGMAAGIDPSIGMLRVAAEDGGGPRYAAATSIDLPFRDGTFDHLLANFVIGFFPHYDTALFDLLRVLRSGGRLGVSWWGPGDNQDDFRTTWRTVAEEFAEHEVLMDAQARAIPWEEKFSDRSVLKDVLHDAGVRDIWTEGRQYRFEMSREDWLTGREVTPVGRFLQQMLGAELWEPFRKRAREVFAERFPEQINDFRSVVLAVGHKP